MASQREVLFRPQRKAQLTNVKSTDERESGTTTLRVDVDEGAEEVEGFCEGTRERSRK